MPTLYCENYSVYFFANLQWRLLFAKELIANAKVNHLPTGILSKNMNVVVHLIFCQTFVLVKEREVEILNTLNLKVKMSLKLLLMGLVFVGLNLETSLTIPDMLSHVLLLFHALMSLKS